MRGERAQRLGAAHGRRQAHSTPGRVRRRCRRSRPLLRSPGIATRAWTGRAEPHVSLGRRRPMSGSTLSVSEGRALLRRRFGVADGGQGRQARRLLDVGWEFRWRPCNASFHEGGAAQGKVRPNVGRMTRSPLLALALGFPWPTYSRCFARPDTCSQASLVCLGRLELQGCRCVVGVIAKRWQRAWVLAAAWQSEKSWSRMSGGIRFRRMLIRRWPPMSGMGAQRSDEGDFPFFRARCWPESPLGWSRLNPVERPSRHSGTCEVMTTPRHMNVIQG